MSIDLRSIANGVSSTVNDNTAIIVLSSNGYTTGAGQRQVPSYAAPANGFGQIQALDNSELRQMENLNVQGTLRALYVRGVLANIIRPKGEGGDLVLVPATNETWLVVKVLETWPLWTKAAIVLQMQPASQYE